MAPRTTSWSPEERANLFHTRVLIASASISSGYLRNIDSTVRLYDNFCHLAGFVAWPISVDALTCYLVDYVVRGNSPNTITQIITRLSRRSSERCLPWLGIHDLFFLNEIKRGLRRTFREDVVRAAPCTMQVILRMIRVADSANILHTLVITMSLVAHNGLLRGGELFALTVGDVVWTSDDRRTCSLRIVRSKTNQTGGPELVPLEDFSKYSAVSFLRLYWDHFGLASVLPTCPLFPVDPRAWYWTPITRDNFIGYFRAMLERAGLNSSSFTPHSFRSGGATDLFRGDCRPHTIKLQGRWVSDAIWLYVRDCPTTRSSEVAAAMRRALFVA